MGISASHEHRGPNANGKLCAPLFFLEFSYRNAVKSYSPMVGRRRTAYLGISAPNPKTPTWVSSPLCWRTPYAHAGCNPLRGWTFWDLFPGLIRRAGSALGYTI